MLSYQSGHRNNVFQARALPATHDATIVSCAADGQVRVAYVSEGGIVETQRLALHNGRAHKLALQPEEPACFLSCGEDGAVMSFDLREANSRGSRRLLVCRDRSHRNSLRASPVELNSIHCNGARPHQFVVGGADAAVRVYDRRMAASSGAKSATDPVAIASPVRFLMPAGMRQSRTREHHVTCAMFAHHSGEIVATYNDEDIYLFASEHDSSARPPPKSCGVHSRNVSSNGDAPHSKRSCIDHRDTVVDSRADPTTVAPPPRASHPAATAAASAASTYSSDTAAPDDTIRSADSAAVSASEGGVAAVQASAPGPGARASPVIPPSDGCGFVDGNSAVHGSHDLQVSRRDPPPVRMQRHRRNAFILPPHLRSHDCGPCGAIPSSSEDEDAPMRGPESTPLEAEDAEESDEVLQRYRGHRNARTVKGVAFAGADDEFVMSGSDCGHLFIWNKVDGKLRACHRGDNSIVNCLEQHPLLPLTIATSGIDDDVKIWTPTADAPSRPSPAIAALVEANTNRDRRSNTVMVTPNMLQRLLAHHALNTGETFNLQPRSSVEASSTDDDEDMFADSESESESEYEAAARVFYPYAYRESQS